MNRAEARPTPQRKHSSRRLALATVVSASLVVSACATPGRAPAPTVAESVSTQMLGIPNARFYFQDYAALTQEFVEASRREIDARRSAGLNGPLPPAAFLALSGGGDSGAYGAGLLAGWTARGDRPSFQGVTGVSTGALSAPFAFLGSAYDDELKAVYTTSSAKRIFKTRGFLAAITDDAMSDTAPLRAMVTRYVDDKMIELIAAEYRKGRLLLVMTTNLDAGEPCVWNIGAIAASGKPGARDLIIKILLASAAIPAVFPPQLFDVEVNGQHRQEMHADGGVFAQAFLYPPGIDFAEATKLSGADRQRDAYLIRNGRLLEDPTQVPRKTLSIAQRSVSMMIASSGINDMYRVYLTTGRDKVGYHLTFIPDAFTEPYKGPFDPPYMTKLYNYGLERGRAGDEWQSKPPEMSR